ncbi:hypothetical protein M2E15_4302 [Bacillus mycoides]|uniref:Uncharacterized protein n=1 Tax=Bacillus mycoides TaxID=1405 RepID=C2Y2U5_BACMY|nr:hypothetical protein bcere0026_52920 [Bacillus mycoides]KUH41031.1 hypothetical protein M2E15_4302 [Bacillus mycoides]KZE08151.1 hypothetical protein B4117_0315 [Bacillus mycoides]OSX89045.1 hypothetical protein BTJ44_04723 [Bacillus mycoides]OSX97819.1 hypothetical protein S2E19_06060 [Bacillus mycoides]
MLLLSDVLELKRKERVGIIMVESLILVGFLFTLYKLVDKKTS